MRPLDPVKQDRIIKAVFTITGRIGLAGVNINGISKEARVGVGSLYTYFKSKDEVIQKAYSCVEDKLTTVMYAGFDLNSPIKESMRHIYMNAMEYRLKHYPETIFIDQYIRSAYVQLNLATQVREFEQQNKPLYQLLRKGQKEGVLKKLHLFMMINFINGAIRSCSNGITQKLIPNKPKFLEDGFDMLWKGITK